MDRAKTRKSHKKSRNGCLPCKGRHVKCDEQKPNCTNCVKQGTAYEYRPPASSEASHTSPLPGQQLLPRLGAAANTASAGTGLALNIPQLRLLHHYMTATAKTLAAHTDAEDVFKTTLVEIAFEHPYLLQATLSLSALHMSRLVRPEEAQEYLIQAQEYREAALDDFHNTVRNIDESNFKAVMLFTGTLFPHACITSIAASNDLDYAFESVISNLVVTRGVRPMIMGFYAQMKVCELSRVIPDDVKNIEFHQKEPRPDTELIQLHKFADVIHHLYPPRYRRRVQTCLPSS
ncbi:hypothetical protein ACJQWK_06688 [Exserohilum turcicum]